jgi:hypothetical protein
MEMKGGRFSEQQIVGILKAALYNTEDMAVRIEMQNTSDPRAPGEIVAIIAVSNGPVAFFRNALSRR